MRFLPGRTASRLLILAVTLAGLTVLVRHVAFSSGRQPEVKPATHGQVMQAIKQPGARAVLVNVWATWCEPCREEMPDILRYYKDRRAQGLRLVLVSADARDQREQVARYLATLGVDFPSYLKLGDDMAFIDGLDPRWDGTLPASMLFDGRGQRVHLWPGKVSYAALASKVDDFLAKAKTPEPGPTSPKPRSKP
jgi:thiol-disulfide isomerase/thioredoxin